MRDFKVGDRVVVCGRIPWESLIGLKGTVREVDGDGTTLVEFDDFMNGHTGMGRICKEGHGWYLESETLKLYKEQEQVIICRKGKQTIAKYKVNGEIVREAVAICNDEDTFDFQYGSNLALTRLFLERVVKQDKYEVGDQVRIINKEQNQPYMNYNVGMEKHLGTIMTIKDVRMDGYRMKEDDEQWFWNDYRIVGKVIES